MLPSEPPIEEGTSTRLVPKGRLKIFLGASPGVGKTFAMLQAAAERKQEGMDVVVGLVETHKRKETEDQLVNLEVLPRKMISYRGRNFEELDLDGILARAPQLVLIDECAHSNLHGSRHPKRYNDIMEILEHGIDVYTTLNIQHLESLKDVVEQMTHVVVRETIPDSFIESAGEVQLIDLPPDDLLQRLADGKVYVPEQAKAAIEHFFSRSNLLALRELALRHTVTVADEEMAHYVQQQGIKGPWPASDKVMVCISPSPSDAHLVRLARRIAERMQAKWIAVTIETPDDEGRSLGVQQQLSQNLQLAEQLGAHVVALDGSNIADTLVQYAQSQNVTDLMVGHHKEVKTWHKIPLVRWLIRRSSIAERILSHNPSLILRVVPILEDDPIPNIQSSLAPLLKQTVPYMVILMITLGMLVSANQIHKHTSIADISILFFVSILWIAIQFEIKPVLFATTISSLAYSYFYTEPKHYLGLFKLEGWLVALSFVFSAFVISSLSSHSRNIFSTSQGRLKQIRFFSGFIQQITYYSSQEEILRYLCQELHRFLDINVIAFWDIQGKNFQPIVQYPETQQFEMNKVDADAIQWALAHQIRSGRSTDNFSDARYLYLPIKIRNYIPMSDDFPEILGPRWGGIFDPVLTPRVGSSEGEIGDEKTISDRWPNLQKIIGHGYCTGVIGIWALRAHLTVDDLRIAQILIDQAALAIDRLHYMKKSL